MNILNPVFDRVMMSSLRASLLVLVVLLAQRILKSMLPSRWRYALWLPVLAALVVPAIPLLPAWMNWLPTSAPTAGSTGPASPSATTLAQMSQAPEPVKILPISSTSVRREANTDPNVSAQVAATKGPAVKPFASPLNWRDLFIVLWLTGTAGVSSIAVASFALTMRRIRRCAQPANAELLAKVAETARGVGLTRTPPVLQSSAVASPAVCGIWRPTLLLHEHFPRDMSPEAADLVLRHELMHIRRQDLAMNAPICALLALHWFNPFLWLAFSRVRADREAACDAQVLAGASATSRAAYGHTLLRMETKFLPANVGLGFVGILQRGSTLRGRIQLIVSQPKENRIMKSLLILSIAFLTIAGCITAADVAPHTHGEDNLKEETKPSLAQFVDGDYTLNVTQAANNLGPSPMIPETAYKPTNDPRSVRLRFFNAGTKVSIVGNTGVGTLETQTDNERIYDLSKVLSGGGELRLKQTSDGILGTYTEFGSGWPVLGSVRGMVTAERQTTLANNSTPFNVDGDYTLKITHLVEKDPATGKLIESPIPDGTFKPVNSLQTFELRFSANGEKVTILTGDKADGNTFPLDDASCELKTKSADTRVYRTIKPGQGNNFELTIAQANNGMLGTLAEVGAGVPFTGFRGLITKNKLVKEWRKKGEAKALFDPIVKAFFARLLPEQAKSFATHQFVVTEYQVPGLWDAMGVQLFGLSDNVEGDCEYFAYADYELTPLNIVTFGGNGIGGAVVSDSALYFTYGAGSGIYRVVLYKLSVGKDHTIAHESLGAFDSNPPDPHDQQFANEMRDVIIKLQPVLKGQSTTPAPAPVDAGKAWVTTEFGRPDPDQLHWSVDPADIKNFQPSGIGDQVVRCGNYTLMYNHGLYWSGEENQDTSKDMQASIIVSNGDHKVFVARGYTFDDFTYDPKQQLLTFQYWTGVMGYEQKTQLTLDLSGETIKCSTKNYSTKDSSPPPPR